MVKYIREDKLWRWANEDGAVGNAAGVKSLPLEVVEEDSSAEMPTSFRIIFLTVVPIAISAIAAILAFLAQGTVRYLLGAISFAAFVWFALQFAWVDEEPKRVSNDDV